jgi:hypothetical protein
MWLAISDIANDMEITHVSRWDEEAFSLDGEEPRNCKC